MQGARDEAADAGATGLRPADSGGEGRVRVGADGEWENRRVRASDSPEAG